MAINIEKINGRAVIRMEGRFDLHSILDFRNTVRPLLTDPEAETLVVDFSHVSFVDSSALGILLLLREQAEEKHKSVVLTHCGPDLQRVLSISQFNRLFRIEK